jgi:hypothetical protein
MKERQILFSTPMVQAILDGRKTMTRRVLKPKLIPFIEKSELVNGKVCLDLLDIEITCPYGIPGDRLWVRETWRRADENCPDGIYYKANNMLVYFDGNEPEIVRNAIEQYPRDGKNKPSIFMPRWASRITLEIVSVRIERLQKITDQDALAEGIPEDMILEAHNYLIRRGSDEKMAFKTLWDSINGKTYPWESNPFVWVIEFKKVED